MGGTCVTGDVEPKYLNILRVQKAYQEFESSLRHVVSTAEKVCHIIREKRRKGRTFAILAERNRTGERIYQRLCSCSRRGNSVLLLISVTLSWAPYERRLCFASGGIGTTLLPFGCTPIVKIVPKRSERHVKIFVSHSTKAAKFVTRLAERMRA
jgi:hypothetical protein